MITNHKEYWLPHASQCMRYQNLVYVLTRKCASTYYQNIFQQNSWQFTTMDQIDWHNDHVFGFIRDPVQRYLKGLAEDLHHDGRLSGCVEELYRFYSSNIMLMSHHSLPYSLTYKNYCSKIDWIPIDMNFDSDAMLSKLLQKYDIMLTIDKTNYRHESDELMHQTYQFVKTWFDKGNWITHSVLAEDNDLYVTVCDRFNSKGANWDKISWLTSYATT